jgi:hypothetical protein
MITAEQILALSIAISVGQEKPSTIVIVPTNWSYSCPAGKVDTNGDLLCSARNASEPLTIERTSVGMKISYVSQCGLRDKPNPFAGKYKYRTISTEVSLKAPEDTDYLRAIFLRNMKVIKKGAKKLCGNNDDINLDVDQISSMIATVFLKKRLPF